MLNSSHISKLKELAQTRAVRFLLRALQIALVVSVLYIMLEKLATIGWSDVWNTLPTSPWFYIFFVCMYFAQPISEWLVYQRLWGPAVKRRLDVFIRMRIYNFALVSYAGEAYLALWGHKTLGKKGKQAISAVKDSSILSGLASNSFTLILLGLFFFTGQLEKITNASPEYDTYLAIAVGLGLIMVPLVIRYHSKILSIGPEQAKQVFFIHLARLIFILILQTGQWAVVFPDVAVTSWLLILTAQMVLTRIPFLPNTDLLFAGLGLSLMGYIDGPEVAIAGMFLASGALAQVLNFTGFILTGLVRNKPTSSDA